MREQKTEEALHEPGCPKAGFLCSFMLSVFVLFNAQAAESPIARRSPSGTTSRVVVLATNGVVEVLRAGARTWDFASPLPEKNILHPGDQLRTGPNSLAIVLLADQTIKHISPNAHLQVLAEPGPGTGTYLFRGKYLFLHRDRPGQVRVRTPTVAAAIRGTEFSIEVTAGDGTTTVHLLDGVVEMSNEFGRLELQSSQAALVEPGKRPVRTPVLEAANVIQWCLYYPAVLDVDELGLSVDEEQALSDSLAAYRSGDLLAALARYPDARAAASDHEKVYRAALGLAVGEVGEAVRWLDELNGLQGLNEERGRVEALIMALRKLIAAVKFQTDSSTLKSELSTCLLAESYYQQSRSNLEEARRAARQAAEISPTFGFAHARLAELEFSFGRVGKARETLEKSLRLSPRNAQAVALRGFLLAAENRITEAMAAFDQAIALDAGLGHAWLGRGLCRIRRGQAQLGREDLEVAAATEPQRALLRSYLGKAFSNAGDTPHAQHELDLAKKLDPNDPTAWLYAALLNQQNNVINQAILDLEHSQELNDNRRVYRSRLRLDEDRAVRGANLANIYRDAGITDVSFREAARAVHDSYANYSAHLFLANSYNELRDPRQVNLRYETPWLSEYLLANLLAPVAAGTLSQTVSQQEYSRLLERNRLGVVSHTEYLSSGDWFQAGANYGLLGNFGYALDAAYRTQAGQRPNNDLDQLTLSLQFKQQITPQDGLYFQASYYTAEAGDLAQYYHPTQALSGLRIKEQQEPLLLAGYHREWAPGVHTLLLGARLQDTLSLSTPGAPVPVLRRNASDVVTNVNLLGFDLGYRSELEIYSAELQQLWEHRAHTVIAGMRYQFGDFETRNRMPAFGPVPMTATNFVTDFHRFSAYGYYHWQVADPLLLIWGLSYDQISFPLNFQFAPVSGQEETKDQLSPKAGLVWNVGKSTAVRAAYTRSLSGVSVDQSVQLEPSQVAGFIQSYRSLIPESAAGLTPVSRFETWGVALDQKFPNGTYLGVSGEWLRSDTTRAVGAFTRTAPAVAFVPSAAHERLDYDEKTLVITLNQLLGNEWALGANYRLSHAELDRRFSEIPAGTPAFGGFVAQQDLEATLHQVKLYAVCNLPSGWFAQFDSVWSAQSNRGYSPDIPGDDFWQFNVHAGFRFPRRRTELRLSLLNLTDQDYRLNPLNLTAELPRERTLAVSLRFAF